MYRWLGGVMVTASDLRSTGRGFDSQPFHYQVATVGQLLSAPWAWAYSTLHP